MLLHLIHELCQLIKTNVNPVKVGEHRCRKMHRICELVQAVGEGRITERRKSVQVEEGSCFSDQVV